MLLISSIAQIILGLYLNYRKEIYYTKIIEESVRCYKENHNSSAKERIHK